MSSRIQFNFIKPGFHTLIVDKTAQGYQKYGLPVGGAMDDVAAEAANWLVGNKIDSPLFEITLIGPQIVFDYACQIAITGADMSPEIDEKKIEMYETINVSKGHSLKFGKLMEGCRAYLAIRGKWRTRAQEKVKNSSIHTLNKAYIEAVKPLSSVLRIKRGKLSTSILVVKVLKGPEYELLSEMEKGVLLSTVFILLPESNRMGYRLSPKLTPIAKSIISSGIVPGTLQITEDGRPILLMKDAPATGGYFRALNVLSEDLHKLGQLKSGDSFRFQFG
jgi:biotin-dependent carboxylase-like uncharacterized protein